VKREQGCLLELAIDWEKSQALKNFAVHVIITSFYRPKYLKEVVICGKSDKP
jgi:hypothetical protein